MLSLTCRWRIEWNERTNIGIMICRYVDVSVVNIWSILGTRCKGGEKAAVSPNGIARESLKRILIDYGVYVDFSIYRYISICRYLDVSVCLYGYVGVRWEVT